MLCQFNSVGFLIEEKHVKIIFRKKNTFEYEKKVREAYSNPPDSCRDLEALLRANGPLAGYKGVKKGIICKVVMLNHEN